MRRAFILISALLMLSGCERFNLMFSMPEGPPEYQLGWQDGCDSGMAAQGGYLYRGIYGFKKRPEMIENDLYKQGWNEGFTFCRYAMAADQVP